MSKNVKEILNLKTFDHISWVVKDARKTAKAWETMLGIGPWHYREWSHDSKGLIGYAYSEENGVEYELIEVIEGRIFHSDFIDKVGEGLHHVGFAVDDVLADTKKLVDNGAEVVMDQGAACQYVRFPDDGGVIVELYRKHPPFLEDRLLPKE